MKIDKKKSSKTHGNLMPIFYKKNKIYYLSNKTIKNNPKINHHKNGGSLRKLDKTYIVKCECAKVSREVPN